MKAAIKKLQEVFASVHLETWIFLVIFIITRHLSNKLYFVLLIIGLISFYLITKNIINSMWFLYISTLPFNKVIPLKLINLYKDLNFNGNAFLLFGDVILMFILYVLVSRKRKFDVKLSRYDKTSILFLVIFILSSGISTIFAQYTLTSFYYFMWLVKSIFLFFIAKIVFTDHFVVKKTLQMFIAFVIINSVFIIGQFLIKGPLGTSLEDTFNQYGKYSEHNLFRPGGLTADPNISSTMIAVAIPFVLFNALTVSSGLTILNWIILVIFTVGLVFTSSRASWIVAFVISIVSVVYLYRTKKIKIPKFVKKYWKTVTLFLFIIIMPVVIGRLSTFKQAFSVEGSGMYRFRQIPVSIMMMQRNVFGIGLGMFQHPITSYNLFERVPLPTDLPHNLMVQIGGETGIIGLTFFSFFMYYLLHSKFDKLKKDATLFSTIMFIMFVSVFLLMLAYPWFMHPRISWLFWLLAAY